MAFVPNWPLSIFLLGIGCLVISAEDNYRLPTTILPQHYNVTLQPFLLETDGNNRFKFNGETYIDIDVKNATKFLVMHTKNLNYTLREYWLSANSSNKFKLDRYEYNNITDKINYTLSTPLAANKTYTLHFVYTGSMDDDMHGFYRSSYQDSENVTKWLGSTQFEPNHARRVFPAFDEPKFKATFDINIIRHKSMKSVSNTELLRSLRMGDYYLDVYERTPIMSSYIIAFLVSEFTERTNGVFAVVARPKYYAQTEYSSVVGQKILTALDNYLDLPYYELGINKMHLAAIPDFSAGAMENWGLLTFRERALLYEEGSTTLSAKQSIAAVVAHEEAHMWFGDLVTCEWWSYAWLNEGFARYFQYFATAMVETDLALDQQFVVDQVQSVMLLDATNSTNPMSDENTNSPADIGRMFNTITYNKGASFIRMIKHAMGEENFQKSLRDYLRTKKYTNAVPADILSYWEKYWPQSHKNQARLVFKDFTEQVGYPLLNITVQNQSMTITQKRFLLHAKDGSDASILYNIPFTFATNFDNFSNTSPVLYLKNTTKSESVSLPSGTKWVVANVQQTGYYRVNYNEENWHNIHQALLSKNWGNIHELNRAQIVDDLLNLARVGKIDYNLALGVLEYLGETETNYLPWKAALTGYSFLSTRLGEDLQDFGKYIRQQTAKVYKLLDFEERSTDSALEIYNRANILSWSCKYGNNACITRAKAYFNNLKNQSVPVNIRSVVYCAAMRDGNEQDFKILFDKYKAETVATEETLIINSLSCVKNPKLVEKYFWIIIGQDIRRQDKSSALTNLYSSNNENVSPVFKLVTNNVEEVAQSLGGYPDVASIISGLAARFTEESQAKELREFNAKNKQKFGSSAKVLERAEDAVAQNLEWSNKHLPSFKKYLADFKANSARTTASTVFSLLLTVLVSLYLQ